jgi:hypothetical protein
VATARVVEARDGVEDSHLGIGVRAPAAARHQFALQGGEAAFRQGIGEERPQPVRTGSAHGSRIAVIGVLQGTVEPEPKSHVHRVTVGGQVGQLLVRPVPS